MPYKARVHWATRRSNIAVPSFGQLCDRFATLEVKRTALRSRRATAGPWRNGEPDRRRHGRRFGRASQWHAVKYHTRPARTPQRKMHVGINVDMNVHDHD